MTAPQVRCCRSCEEPLDAAIAHCPSRSCPWCRRCTDAKAGDPRKGKRP